MAVNRKSLPLVVARVAFFWWCVFTIIAFGLKPREIITYFLDNAGFFVRYLYLIGFVVVLMSALVGLAVYAIKMATVLRLRASKFMGLSSTVGNIPLPNPPLPRIKEPKRRLPITGKRLQQWFDAQHTEKPGTKDKEKVEMLNAHGKLFLAIWDTYCAHAHYPASHRLGGHGDKRLYAHCHDVAEHAMELAQEGWQYTGVYVKKRGRKARLIMEPNSPKSVLNSADPIIPIVALAHDIGKIEAYKIDDQGNIIENREEESNTLDDDDGRVLHDMLAPRALALMPEFWKIDHRDRLAINMALAHYHHPSAFPLDRYERLLDERAASVMALLIDADRAVSAKEADLSQDKANEEMDEALEQEIYQAFVDIILQPGRINGVGNPEENAMIQLGQKHENFIAIQEKRLRSLMLRKMNWSKDDSDNRYHLTVKLLTVLKEKGLLYVEHGGVDFSAYLPMYKVALYHHAKTRHLADLAPAIVIKIPSSSFPELEPMSFMSIHPAKAIIKHPMLTHLSNIKDPQRLNEMITQAFDQSDIEHIEEDLTKEDDTPDPDGEEPQPPEQDARTPDPEPEPSKEEAAEPLGTTPEEPPSTQIDTEPQQPTRPLRRAKDKKPLRLTDLDATRAAQVDKTVQRAIDKNEQRKASKEAQHHKQAEEARQASLATKRKVDEQIEEQARDLAPDLNKDEEKALFGDLD